MKSLTFSIIFFFTIFACGQTPKRERLVSQTDYITADTTEIYKTISLETCNCTFSTMRNNKPSTSIDSCYKAVLLKYTDTLKRLGFDPAKQVGQLKLVNEVVGKLQLNCPGLSKQIQKEYEAENKKKLLFNGELVSQTKISSGLYEIVMANKKSKEMKTFYAKTPLDETQIIKYEPGYEMTVEYEVVKNETTKKDENHLKEFGTVTSVGAVKATPQQ
ncbi:hypothetical protein ACX0G7_27170 [Flavitalea antarctica]